MKNFAVTSAGETKNDLSAEGRQQRVADYLISGTIIGIDQRKTIKSLLVFLHLLFKSTPVSHRQN